MEHTVARDESNFRQSTEERSLRARMGAHALHATHDSRAITANARAGFMEKFEREVDPEGILSVEERQKRASHARKAHMLRLAHKSLMARRKRGGSGG